MYREDQENRPITSFTTKNFEINSGFSKGTSEIDSDPNSVSLIGDLMSQEREWTGVQEIIKLTLKALFSTIKNQSRLISEIENVLPMKANKIDIQSIMSTKANVKEVKLAFGEITQNIDNKTNFEDVQKIIDSRLDKIDIKSTARGMFVFYFRTPLLLIYYYIIKKLII